MTQEQKQQRCERIKMLNQRFPLGLPVARKELRELDTEDLKLVESLAAQSVAQLQGNRGQGYYYRVAARARDNAEQVLRERQQIAA